MVEGTTNEMIESFIEGQFNGRIYEEFLERNLYSQDQAEIPALIKNLFSRPPKLVIQPKNAEDVVRLVKKAYEKGIPIVPRGAASSAFGNILPMKGGIIIDLSLLRGILSLNEVNDTVTVEAGVRWDDLHYSLLSKGYSIRTYPSSWFSTVGGWISTGGFGINSYKYGHIKDQVNNLKIVSYKGQIKDINSNNSEFPNYFGTDGQMGIILNVELKIRKDTGISFPHLFQFDDSDRSYRFIQGLIDNEVDLSHITHYNSNHIKQFNRLMRENHPNAKCFFEEKDSVLINLEDQKDEGALSEYTRDKEIECQRHLAHKLWNERFFAMSTKRFGPTLLASELLLPISKLHEYVEMTSRLGREHGVEISTESHIVDRKEALTISSFLTNEKNTLGYLSHLALVMMLIESGLELNGRIYDVGAWMTPFIEHKFNRDTLVRLQSFKRSEDPFELGNPGKFFSLETKYLKIPLNLLTPSTKVTINILRSLSYVLGRVSASLQKHSFREDKPKTIVERTVLECARCGSCVPVCPAYIVTEDESVTARGKLFFIKQYLNGIDLSKEQAERMFLCTHCKACERVCQTELSLIDVWEKWEKHLERRFGRPTEIIEKFVDDVERNEKYHELKRRGIVSVDTDSSGRIGLV
jgi:FAD/FMN-containing dehydrogenase/ferredoxin